MFNDIIGSEEKELGLFYVKNCTFDFIDAKKSFISMNGDDFICEFSTAKSYLHIDTCERILQMKNIILIHAWYLSDSIISYDPDDPTDLSVGEIKEQVYISGCSFRVVVNPDEIFVKLKYDDKGVLSVIEAKFDSLVFKGK